MSAVEKPGQAEAGRVLAGRYRLLRLIGHGGMGSVYEAMHVHTEKRVAVKLLSPTLSKDLKLVARFRREAMAASRLEHENCVHVDDFGEDADGTFYIAMEIVDGHGLADELRKVGPMPWERVARIAAQLLKALDAAHVAGVLHRDLKPQNVMIAQKPGRADIVKVVDFGIAKITTNSAEDQGALTVPGTIFGTPEYMSPEQARGEVLDARSDVYSAAVVLWHMLLGRSPFRGNSVRETLMRVFTDEALSPAQERPTARIPAGFEALLRQAMAKRKEDRFADAASFLEALRPWVQTDGAELPRRPAPGLARDGAAPPSTIDDSVARSATLVLPEADLPPLDRALLRDAVPGNAKSPGGAGRSAHGRRARLSAAALAVLTAAALGVVTILVGAWFVLRPEPRPRRAQAAPVALLVDAGAGPAAKEPLGALEVPSDPVGRDAALARAEKAMEQGDAHAAVAAYNEAINADPVSARAHLGRATVAMGLRDWETAREHFERAMALDPEYARKLAALHARAKMLAEQQRR